MPLFGLNTNDIWVKNLRLDADDTEVNDAVLTASVYNQNEMEKANPTAIVGAANITLTYQPVTVEQTIEGHYRGSVASSVGLTLGRGSTVMVHYKDDGTYGIDVKVITTVERRTS